jgi:hypothetical protein
MILIQPTGTAQIFMQLNPIRKLYARLHPRCKVEG